MCAFNANEDLRSDCQKTYTNNCHAVTRVSDSSENYKCVKYKKLKYKNVMKLRLEAELKMMIIHLGFFSLRNEWPIINYILHLSPK